MKKKSEFKINPVVKFLILIVTVPVLCIAAVVVPFVVSHYYETRMVRNIEWDIQSENLRGKKITAEFIDMETSSFDPVKRTFRIGETEKLILSHTLFIFDPDSVHPENIMLELDDPEMLEYKHWDDENNKIIFTGKPVRFTVSEKKTPSENPAE